MQIGEKNLTVADRSLSAGRPALGTDKKLHDLFSVILGEYNDLKTGDHLMHNKLIDLEKRQYMLQFKDWSMPEQSSGYIKPRKHDFL